MFIWTIFNLINEMTESGKFNCQLSVIKNTRDRGRALCKKLRIPYYPLLNYAFEILWNLKIDKHS